MRLSPPLLALPVLSSALPTSDRLLPTSSRPLPLLIWHGLGDKFDNPGLQSTGALAAKTHPGTHVHYIRVSNTSSEDQRATFFGNITAQSLSICSTLLADPKLRDPETGIVRVDALGFSQGGQFLRGLVERCEGLSVRSLVTFGSQHDGIAKFQECGTWDLLCKGASALVGNNAWTDYVQRTVVPAQYFREVNETSGEPTEGYLAHSHFLADVNNEVPAGVGRKAVYGERLEALERFVMVVFEEDTTVVPKESGWFAEVNATSGEVLPLRERRIYQEDWIGLRALDEKGGLVFGRVPGGHMELREKDLKKTFEEFFGPEKTWQARGGGGVMEMEREGDEQAVRLAPGMWQAVDALRASWVGQRLMRWREDL